MENANLIKLIKAKGFDDYQNGLCSRFSSEEIIYNYHYEEKDSINSVVVFLEKGETKTRIELNENGDLNFYYSRKGKENKRQFEYCSEDDFHIMLAHAFIYIRDGNFDYHKKWYSNLNVREK